MAFFFAPPFPAKSSLVVADKGLAEPSEKFSKAEPPGPLLPKPKYDPRLKASTLVFEGGTWMIPKSCRA